MGSRKKNLKKSIMLRCMIMIVVLCGCLSIANYFGYRRALFTRYRAYITDVLQYAESNIDVDDLKECLATGQKSEKFKETQQLFDNIKDTHAIDFIYVIIPQNTEPVDNIMNVIAGMSAYEKKYIPENKVELGGLTGTDYTPENAAKYYDAMDAEQKVTFIEDWGDRWGLEYTGIMSLYDSDGNFFAELCVDVPFPEIKTVITEHVLLADLIVLIVGILFMAVFIIWTKKSITDPILQIERSVVDFASRSHEQPDSKELVMDMPEIKTENELQSLSEAIMNLSRDMRDYLLNALSARDDAQAARARAMEMSEQASKDSLTGIRNRRAYDTEVKKIEWKIKTEGFKDFGVAVVDLNFLKKINDSYGNEKGNQAIIRMCMIVCHVFSHSPVFRIGGDEFAVLLENEDYINAEERMKEFDETLSALKEDEKIEEWEKVSAAVGWSKFEPGIDVSVDEVFRRADMNMYENKKGMKAERED